MSHWFIETKKQTVAFMPFENHGVIRVSLHEKQKDGIHRSDDKTVEVVLIPLTDKHIKKLQSYKSVSALVRYAKANQIEQATPDNDAESIPDNGACSSPCPAPVPVPAESVQGQGIPITECDQAINSESVSNTSLGDDPIHHHRDTLFVDTQTTGLSYKDEIVEIAIVDSDENIVFESLVKPSKPIPDKATKIHGITNAMVANAPPFHQLWNDLYTLMAGKNLCFYNASRDKRMIYQTVLSTFGSDSFFQSKHKFEHLFTGYNNTPDITCLRARYERYYSRKSLIGACWEQAIYINDLPRNRATGDAIKTARLYKHLATPLDHSEYGHPRKLKAGI